MVVAVKNFCTRSAPALKWQLLQEISNLMKIQQSTKNKSFLVAKTMSFYPILSREIRTYIKGQIRICLHSASITSFYGCHKYDKASMTTATNGK